MAGQRRCSFPANAYFCTNEDGTHLLGLSCADLGKPGLLHKCLLYDYLPVHSSGQDLESRTRRRPLYQLQCGVCRYRCCQRFFRLLNLATSTIGYMASPFGAKAKTWNLGSICYRIYVGAVYIFSEYSKSYANGLSSSAFASSICRLAYTTKFFTGRDTTYFPAQVGMWT